MCSGSGSYFYIHKRKSQAATWHCKHEIEIDITKSCFSKAFCNISYHITRRESFQAALVYRHPWNAHDSGLPWHHGPLVIDSAFDLRFRSFPKPLFISNSSLAHRWFSKSVHFVSSDGVPPPKKMVRKLHVHGRTMGIALMQSARVSRMFWLHPAKRHSSAIYVLECWNMNVYTQVLIFIVIKLLEPSWMPPEVPQLFPNALRSTLLLLRAALCKWDVLRAALRKYVLTVSFYGLAQLPSSIAALNWDFKLVQHRELTSWALHRLYALAYASSFQARSCWASKA